MSSGNPELRTALTRLTYPPAEAGLEWLEWQVKEIALLKGRYAHGIELIQLSCDATAELNCFCYALGTAPEAICDMRLANVQPGSDFVDDLLCDDLCLRSAGRVLPDNIIFYFDDSGLPKHAGIMTAQGNVRSKWGSGRTHIWTHGIWEVPVDYGNEVRFAEPLKVGEAVRAYRLSPWLSWRTR